MAQLFGQVMILTIEAEDTSNTVFVAAAISGAGTVAVGATVGVLLVNNTAEAYIDDNAVVNVEDDLLIRSRTSELVGAGALSAGGSGVASVQGTIMAQKVTSKSRAFIDDAAINDNTSEASSQSVAIRAESDTELVSFSGSGGGALVGVGITGDVMVLEKETKAYIDDDAVVRSGGDVDVRAQAQADMIQIAASINGGFVGVTGAAGVAVANNVTEARIGRRANIFARDSINVQATDDTEIDGIVITGAGGAVGVSGSIGTYVIQSRTTAVIDEDAAVTALADGNGLTALSGEIDNSTIETRTQDSRDQEGGAEQRDIELVQASFDVRNVRGVNVAAVTYEDINFAPVGVAGGVVGVAGVIATTVANSTTEAVVQQGAEINGGNNNAASANQSVSLLAASDTHLNNVSAGIGVGAVGVTFDIDTQVFKKDVRARMLGNANAKNDITVNATSKNYVFQTPVTIAGGAVGVGGIVAVSVVNDTVVAEIGDNSTAVAGDDLSVLASSDLNIYQTAGNVAVGGVGVGASVSVLVAKSETTAEIGAGANIHASDNLTVMANSDTDINKNVMGFSGGGVGVSGSIGVNVLKNTTLAKIGNNTQVNQMSEDNQTTQSVNILARDNLNIQTASGAAAVGLSGYGMGLSVTALRASSQAIVGDNVVLSARRDVTVDAQSNKNINNTSISFAGGAGDAGSGSVALTIIGGAMSGDSGDYLENDDGNMIAAVEDETTQDRNAGDNETHNGRKTSGKSNQLYASQYDQSASNLAESESSGLQNDVEGAGGSPR